MIYLLMVVTSDQYGTTKVAGAYWTQALAEEAKKPMHGYQTYIVEWEVDAAPRFVG